MKAQRCYHDDRLTTFFVYLLGCYAEIWAWRELGEIECLLASQ